MSTTRYDEATLARANAIAQRLKRLLIRDGFPPSAELNNAVRAGRDVLLELWSQGPGATRNDELAVLGKFMAVVAENAIAASAGTERN